jgi:hypothetical protein
MDIKKDSKNIKKPNAALILAVSSTLFLTGCGGEESLFGNTKPENKKTVYEQNAEEEKSSFGFLSNIFGGEEESNDPSSRINAAEKSKLKEENKKLVREREIVANADIEKRSRFKEVSSSYDRDKSFVEVAKTARLKDVNRDLAEKIADIQISYKNRKNEYNSNLDDIYSEKIERLGSILDSKISDVSADAEDQKQDVIADIDSQVSFAKKKIESSLMKRGINNEMERFYQFKEQEKVFNQEYKIELAGLESDLFEVKDRELNNLRSNIITMTESNEKLLKVRTIALEKKRIANEERRRIRLKKENVKSVELLAKKLNVKISEYSNQVMKDVGKDEERRIKLLKADFVQQKSIRERNEEEYNAGLSSKILMAKEIAGNRIIAENESSKNNSFNLIERKLDVAIAEIKGSRGKLEDDLLDDKRTDLNDRMDSLNEAMDSEIGDAKERAQSKKLRVLDIAKEEEYEVNEKIRLHMDRISSDIDADTERLKSRISSDLSKENKNLEIDKLKSDDEWWWPF